MRGSRRGESLPEVGGISHESSAKQRLAIFVNSPTIGGAEIYAANLGVGLQNRGWEVVLFVPMTGPLRTLYMMAGLNVERTPMPPAAVRWRGLGSLAVISVPHLLLMVRAGLMVRRKGGYHVMLQDPTQQVWAAAFAPWLGNRVLWMSHSPLHFAAMTWPLRPLHRRLQRHSKAILTVSQIHRRALIEGGALPERIHVLPNGREPRADYLSRSAVRARYGINEASLVLGTFSRLERAKGVHLAVGALRRLRDTDFPGTVLLIVGEGQEKQRLAALAAQLGVGDAVVFAGHLRDAPAIMRGCDVIIVPSIDGGDSLPSVIPEAFFAKVPVVATSMGGIPEIVRDGETGILIERPTEEDIARAVVSVRSRPGLSARLISTAERLALSEYTISAMLDRFEGVVAMDSSPIPRIR